MITYRASRRYGLLLCALASALLVMACGGKGKAATEATPVDTPAITVRTVAVSRETLTTSIAVTGTLQGESEVLLPAEGSGVVVSRGAIEGSVVKQGELLLQQDSAILGRQLAAAQADLRSANALLAKIESGARDEERIVAQQDLARAQATYDKAHADAVRAQSLFDGGTISRSELESALTNEQLAQAGLSAAQANLQIIDTGARTEDINVAKAQRDGAAARVGLYQTQIEQTRVTAPFEGYLIEYLIEVGEMASPGTPVARLTALGNLELRLSLPDTQILGLSTGMTVPVTLTAMPEGQNELQGTITYLAPAADGMTRLFEVRLAIPNTDQLLKSGLVATARLPLASSPNSLIVPSAAVLSPGDGPHVYVVKDGLASRRSIVTGLAADGKFAVTDGLAEGEKVIVEGQLMVREGAAVQEAGTAPASTPNEAPTAE